MTMTNIQDLFDDLDLQKVKEQRFYIVLCEIFPLQRIKTKKRHRLACQVLERLMEYLGGEQRTLNSPSRTALKHYIDALGLLIEDYERSRYPHLGQGVKGIEILQFLMQEHALQQNDLKEELGGQSVASELLSGKRQLNVSQIRALSHRFGVSPSVFFDS